MFALCLCLTWVLRWVVYFVFSFYSTLFCSMLWSCSAFVFSLYFEYVGVLGYFTLSCEVCSLKHFFLVCFAFTRWNVFCIVSPHETEAEPNLVALPRGIVVSVVSHQMMVMMVTMLIMMMVITMIMVMLMVMMVGSIDKLLVTQLADRISWCEIWMWQVNVLDWQRNSSPVFLSNYFFNLLTRNNRDQL